MSSSRDTNTGSFIRFGDDLLSHTLRCSTIGATVLNGRVRDGTGCFTRAMITKPNKRPRVFQVSTSCVFTLWVTRAVSCNVCMTDGSQYKAVPLRYLSAAKSCFYWIKSSLSDN